MKRPIFEIVGALLVFILGGVLAFLLVGCASDSNDMQRDAGPDPLVDAALDDAGNPIPPMVDAAVNPGLVNVPLNCTSYTYRVAHTSTDGSRDDTIESWALTDLIPGDDFLVTTCDPSWTDPLPCGGGNTCSGTNPPQPAGQRCAVSRGGGVFIAGRLAILCSRRTERYGNNGQLQSFTQTTYTVKLEVIQ